MVLALKTLTLLVVAVAIALPLAHALEWPGKTRLSQDQYRMVQPIYFPGFTIAGFAEPLGAVLMLILTLITPAGSLKFWLMVGALLSLLAMHGTYWLMTHPVNKFWLENFKLSGAGAGFFAFDPLKRKNEEGELEWTALRDRWEFSHLVRAVFGVLGFLLLTVAVAI